MVWRQWSNLPVATNPVGKNLDQNWLAKESARRTGIVGTSRALPLQPRWQIGDANFDSFDAHWFLRRSILGFVEVEIFKLLLHGCPFAILTDGRFRVGFVAPALKEVFPGGSAARLKIVHEIPQRRPKDVMGKARKPGDVYA